ncbi:hypothetical protein [Streptococcus orisratti]|uniref:hypothetical protein n=1 Tax=Streptococcus orisratti TaxID=114652 RepID=UPI0023F90BE5|nr:hypothetical protein [Streptococcus orisratti]
MKHLLTRFEKNLYEWQFWTADVVKDFKSYLKENGESQADKKSKNFQNALIIGFAYKYNRRLFNAIDGKGFKY